MMLAIGLDDEHAINMISSRFAWMRRYGAMEKHPDEPKRWRLSVMGEMLIRGKLSKREHDQLMKMSDDKLVFMTREVTNRYRHTGAVGAQLARREWIYGTSKKRFT
jgi:hypothetical protein